MRTPRDEVLVRLGSSHNNRRALIVVPHAGSGTAAFASWAPIINDIAGLWCARFPGRETRLLEPPLTTIEEMASSLVKRVQELEAATLVLFGHCSGAFVAYELAHRLAADQERRRDVRLIISGHAPPETGGAKTNRRTSELPLKELIDELRKLGGTPARVLESVEMLTLLEPGIRADFRAAEEYSQSGSRPPLTIPLTVIGGKKDDLVSTGKLNEWRNYTSGPFKLRLLNAGHFYLMEQATTQLLRELILAR